jgi:hypothetical protein
LFMALALHARLDPKTECCVRFRHGNVRRASCSKPAWSLHSTSLHMAELRVTNRRFAQVRVPGPSRGSAAIDHVVRHGPATLDAVLANYRCLLEPHALLQNTPRQRAVMCYVAYGSIASIIWPRVYRMTSWRSCQTCRSAACRDTIAKRLTMIRTPRQLPPHKAYQISMPGLMDLGNLPQPPHVLDCCLAASAASRAARWESVRKPAVMLAITVTCLQAGIICWSSSTFYHAQQRKLSLGKPMMSG